MNEKKLDETIIGGRYIQDGIVVDADAKPIEGLTVKGGEIVEAKPKKDDK